MEFDGQAAALLMCLQARMESRLCCGLTGYVQVVVGSFPSSAAWGDVSSGAHLT